MKVSRESYWNVIDYIFTHSHFIEDSQNPKDMIALDFSEDGKGVWLKDILDTFTNERCTKEELLTIFHILEVREIIRMNYNATKKDHRIMDLTSKGYEEYLVMKDIL